MKQAIEPLAERLDRSAGQPIRDAKAAFAKLAVQRQGANEVVVAPAANRADALLGGDGIYYSAPVVDVHTHQVDPTRRLAQTDLPVLAEPPGKFLYEFCKSPGRVDRSLARTVHRNRTLEEGVLLCSARRDRLRQVLLDA